MKMPSLDHRNKLMSPVRHKQPAQLTSGAGSPVTPAAIRRVHERRHHQPSPNRTEAAAAMMHLFSSSATDVLPVAKTRKLGSLAAGGARLKRRYVRKNPSAMKQSLETAAKSPAPAATSRNQKTTTETATTAVSDEKNAKETETKKDKNVTEFGDSKLLAFREYNRKEKSLGLLCENFLKLYRDDHLAEICLDRAARELGVERRRIYDIVNILESIHLVSRKSKNLYNWHGLSALPVSVEAMKQRYSEAALQTASGASSADFNSRADRRRGKSLSKLSQMFVQLFLVKDACIIPLDEAAKQLIQLEETENEEDRQLKTKIRRLYDVANVLVSVGLVEKLQLATSRKPLFRWKNRPASSLVSTSDRIKMEVAESADAVVVKAEPSDYEMMRDEDGDEVIRSSQSGDSDISEDGSDSSLSDSPDARALSRKRRTLPKNEESSFKRIKQEIEPVALNTASSSPKISKPADSSVVDLTISTDDSLLQFDTQGKPVHPQLIMQQQQQQLQLYMQQYIREFVGFKLAEEPSSKNDAATSSEASIMHMAEAIHRTPLSLPSLTNRVTGDLVGSLQDLLFPTNNTSPQCVSEFFHSSSSRQVVDKPPTVAAKTASSALASSSNDQANPTRNLASALSTPHA